MAKERDDTVKIAFGAFCAKFQPKLNRIQKTLKKQGFLVICFVNLMIFPSLLNFGSILAQKLNRSICKILFWVLFCTEALKLVGR